MATEDKRIDQLPAVASLDLTSLLALQQGLDAKKITLQQLLNFLNDNVDTQNVVLYVAQSLTEDQKLQARTNIGAAATGEGGSGGGTVANAVLYTEQELTDDQQEQARINIRCGVSGESSMAHATGENALAGGLVISASGDFSSAMGANLGAKSRGQHVVGISNIVDSDGKYIFIIGNGTFDETTYEFTRSNAHTVDWSGMGWFAGGLKVGGTGQDDENAQDILPCSVQYIAQTLTEVQQRQARRNIRCGSVGEVADNCVASGGYCHAEGYGTTASSFYSHAEGNSTTASGNYSHAEGVFTKASGHNSHAEGYYTRASRRSQHTQGEYNIEDTEGSYEGARGKYAHIVGNGTASDARSNAHTLDWAGVPWFAGDRVMLGGTGMDDENAIALMPIFVAQTLTDAQKLQARTNIGAASVQDVLEALPVWEGGSY